MKEKENDTKFRKTEVCFFLICEKKNRKKNKKWEKKPVNSVQRVEIE